MSARVGAPLSAVGCAVGGAASGPVPVAGVAGIVLLWKHVAVVGGSPRRRAGCFALSFGHSPRSFRFAGLWVAGSGSLPRPCRPPAHRALRRERLPDTHSVHHMCVKAPRRILRVPLRCSPARYNHVPRPSGVPLPSLRVGIVG